MANSAYEIGKTNALEAIDQAGSREYPTLALALEDYATNAIQTDASADFDEIARGFLDVLKRHNITYRPHGF